MTTSMYIGKRGSNSYSFPTFLSSQSHSKENWHFTFIKILLKVCLCSESLSQLKSLQLSRSFSKIIRQFLFVLSPRYIYRPLVYVPGDRIIREGDYGQEMFFINEGSVEVVVKKANSTQPERTVILKKGDHFGEVFHLFILAL